LSTCDIMDANLHISYNITKSARWRKKKPRNINYTPTLVIRQPLDGTKQPGTVHLGHDELEALRLKNINKLGIITAAKQMGISKSLFAKIYIDATTKVTQALIYGRSLHIELTEPEIDLTEPREPEVPSEY
jgi:predicted DNA-binding protein (UPF0251 family)